MTQPTSNFPTHAERHEFELLVIELSPDMAVGAIRLMFERHDPAGRRVLVQALRDSVKERP